MGEPANSQVQYYCPARGCAALLINFELPEAYLHLLILSPGSASPTDVPYHSITQHLGPRVPQRQEGRKGGGGRGQGRTEGHIPQMPFLAKLCEGKLRPRNGTA